MMAHWHDFNPWADCLVYLPDLEELSACLDPLDPEQQLKRWEREQEARGLDKRKLDAYILPQPSGYHDCGIRWGKEPEEYYSPPIDPHIAALLLAKYDRIPAGVMAISLANPATLHNTLKKVFGE